MMRSPEEHSHHAPCDKVVDAAEKAEIISEDTSHRPFLSLQEMCANILAKEAKTFRGWCQLAERAEYFQTDACRIIQDVLLNQARDYYPMLREKHGVQELKDTYRWIDWDDVERHFQANRLETTRFVQMKGAILDRPVPAFDPKALTYSFEQLKSGVVWPPNVDPTKREQYLGDNEFFSIFKMTKAEFRSLPSFKRINMKKDLCLF